MKVSKLLSAILFGFCYITTVIAASEKPASLAGSYAAYNKAESADEKATALSQIISVNDEDAHTVFYGLLMKADENEINCFKVALKKSGTTELLIGLSSFLGRLTKPYRDEVEKNPNMSMADKLEVQKRANQLLRPLAKNMELLVPEWALIARKNPKVLVKAVEKVFANEEGNDSDFAGPMLGLLSMKEDGATAFLDYVDSSSKSSGTVMVLMTKAFGPQAVIPVLKKCENPSSTASERRMAGMAIFALPDDELIYDKVIEAYLHGRYFELKTNKSGKLDMAALMDAAGSWWGNHLKGKYRDNKSFVEYAARNYLKNPANQPKMIEFLGDINLGVAAPYFLALDFSKIPEASIDALSQMVFVPIKLSPLEEPPSERLYRAEKFSIFCALFKSMSPDVRAKKQMVLSLSGFSPEYKDLFVESNIGILTDEEKTTIAFSCSDDALGEEKMPKEIQKSILKILRKDASQKVLDIIDYMEKKETAPKKWTL